MENALSRKIVVVSPQLFAHWCLACDGFHLVHVAEYNGKQDRFWNGDVETPTFYRSLGTPNHCHYRITDGWIIYQPDCKHSMANQSYTLPWIPRDIMELFD